MKIENEKKENFADLLLRLGSKQSTRENFNFLLEVLPPVITNYKEGEGFDAFLGGDALDIKFCNVAKKEALIYKGYCTTSSGEILELTLSVPAFRHYFNN